MKTVLMMITVSVIFLGGCTAGQTGRTSDGNNVLDKNGVPKRTFFVGSGVYVEFEAPEDGHVYLVDENSGKSIIVKPLGKGETYDFDVKYFSKLDPEERGLLQKEGIDPDNMKFSVYFVPAGDMFQRHKQIAFEKNGIPKQEYYVGGGYDLNYRAPTRGIIYVVEANSGKLIQSQGLSENELFELPINPMNGDHQKRLRAMGIDPGNMKLQLYFIPEPQTE